MHIQEIRSLLAQRTVPYELLERMMESDGGEAFETDGPASGLSIAEAEASVGELPKDYRDWIARFGAACTQDESVIVYGISISTYKSLRRPGKRGLEIATLEEGDDVRILGKEGSVASTQYDDWYPCFGSFMTSLLCERNPRLLAEFEEELGRLPVSHPPRRSGGDRSQGR